MFIESQDTIMIIDNGAFRQCQQKVRNSKSTCLKEESKI